MSASCYLYVFFFIQIYPHPITCRMYRALRDATKLALSGRPIYNGISEQALTTNFELLNLVPGDHPYHSKVNDNQGFFSISNDKNAHNKKKRSATNAKNANVSSETKWRRVGLVSATTVQLNTIVWPGGDIVVSGKVILFLFSL